MDGVVYHEHVLIWFMLHGEWLPCLKEMHLGLFSLIEDAPLSPSGFLLVMR
jgi:hypothetical protein